MATPGNVGFIRRVTTELKILNGDPIMAGNKFAPAAPVDSATGFYSGEPMLFTTDANRRAVFKDCALGAGKRGSVCFALTDYLCSGGTPIWTPDASGVLQGISTSNSGTEIATAFFDTTKTYRPGDPLTVKQVTNSNIGNKARSGYVVSNEVSDSDYIIGYVSQGVVELGTPATINGVPAVYQNGYPVYATESSAVTDANGNKLSYTVGGAAQWVNDSETSAVLVFVFSETPNLSGASSASSAVSVSSSI